MFHFSIVLELKIIWIKSETQVCGAFIFRSVLCSTFDSEFIRCGTKKNDIASHQRVFFRTKFLERIKLYNRRAMINEPHVAPFVNWSPSHSGKLPTRCAWSIHRIASHFSPYVLPMHSSRDDSLARGTFGRALQTITTNKEKVMYLWVLNLSIF